MRKLSISKRAYRAIELRKNMFHRAKLFAKKIKFSKQANQAMKLRIWLTESVREKLSFSKQAFKAMKFRMISSDFIERIVLRIAQEI